MNTEIRGDLDKMYKAVISDLDGTLLNSNHEVSEYTRKVIKGVLSRGVKFFIATGRHHIDASYIRDKLDLDTILISSNGARAHNSDGKILFSRDVEPDIISKILGWEIDEQIHVNVYQGDKWLVNRESDEAKNFHSESGFLYEVMDLPAMTFNGISKMCFISKNEEKLALLQDKLMKEYGNNLNITYSLPVCLEIMSKEVSKGATLSRVLKQYNISPEECLAFGDGLNDFEMLNFVGRGVLMGNTSEDLKSLLPDKEVTTTNNEDGVARYLERVYGSV